MFMIFILLLDSIAYIYCKNWFLFFLSWRHYAEKIITDFTDFIENLHCGAQQIQVHHPIML